MHRRKPQPPRCPPTRLPHPLKKFLRIILITHLIVGDRLSGWSDVFGTHAGTTVTGANALVRLLQSYFATF